MPSAEQIAHFEDRLRTDRPFYARKCLSIVDQNARRVPLTPKPAQLELDRRISRQEEQGRPVRIIILKARKEGMSTWVQAVLTHRYTQRPNHKALVVAHDKDTAKEIFQMGELMYAGLPKERVGELDLKPDVVTQQRGYGITVGNPNRKARQAGDMGLNSSYLVDTANEVAGGRGFTYFTIHASELAFYGDVTTKMISLLNAVPETPETMVIIESTANGMNAFHKLWTDAEQGKNDYEPVFFAWFDDPDYVRPFPNEYEREVFVDSVIGSDEYGQDEPDLIELLEAKGFTWDEDARLDLRIPERLYWRRHAIANRTLGDVSKFKQEYPSTPAEAFLASSKLVFNSVLVQRAISDTAAEEKPRVGILEPKGLRTIKRRGKEMEVIDQKAGVLWTPRSEVRNRRGRAWVDVWEEPFAGAAPKDAGDTEKPPGQYIVAFDAASGDQNESGELDSHCIQVINHRTLMQCAKHTSKLDPDEVADLALLLALHYNDAWIIGEMTGGWGAAMMRRLQDVHSYGRLYRRRAQDSRKNEKSQDRLGWSTDVKTKPMIESHFKQLLREGAHGLRDPETAGELPTYVRDPDTNKTGAEATAHDDQVMAWMIAQWAAFELFVRPHRRKGAISTSTGNARVRM